MADMVASTDAHAAPPLIVVVDDDEDIHSVLDLALQEAGYRTRLLGQGAEAAPIIRQAQPALVILDLWMEHIDSGVAILHTLHADPTTRTIPVIVASAHPFMRPELADLLREPQYVFVQKPFPLDTLLQTIAALLAPTTPSDPDRAA